MRAVILSCRSWLHCAAISGIIILTSLCLFGHEFIAYTASALYSGALMASLLLAGIFFLFFHKRNLVVISFTCAGLLAFQMKEQIPQADFDLVLDDSQLIKLSMINGVDATYDIHEIVGTLSNQQIELVAMNNIEEYAIREVTQGWRETYPYSLRISIDNERSHLMLSRNPIFNKDTFYISGVPILQCDIANQKGQRLRIFTLGTTGDPTIDNYLSVKSNLRQLVGNLKNQNIPSVMLADLGTAPWSSDIKRFKSLTGMVDSRVRMRPISHLKYLSPFVFPMDYFFHSEDLQCQWIRELYDDCGKQIGWEGGYAFKSASDLLTIAN